MKPVTVRIKRLEPISADMVSDHTEILSDTALVIRYPDQPLVLSLELVPDDQDRQEEIAFDLGFDPTVMCAVCVAGLNPVRGLTSFRRGLR